MLVRLSKRRYANALLKQCAKYGNLYPQITISTELPWENANVEAN
jgi:hypothetical protein